MNCRARDPECTKAIPPVRIVDMKRTGAIPVVLAALLVAGLSGARVQTSLPDQETAWVCPMHPDYTMDNPGKCPRCGMALVHASPFDVRDYRLEFSTVPAVVRAGQRAKFLFRIFHPGTGEAVTKFETVHERQYHLFVISQDMESFQHIHPEESPNGEWSIDVTIPKAGYYKILSDFMPAGGAPQFLARPLVTAGYAGDLASNSAHLVPDMVSTKTVDDITATLSYDPPSISAGQYVHLNFNLTDTHERQADHRSSNLSWSVRPHADHE